MDYVFPVHKRKGDDYIRFLLEQKFTPQNIYAKTEVKVSSIQEFEEIKEDEETDPEEVETIENGEEKLSFAPNSQKKLRTMLIA